MKNLFLLSVLSVLSVSPAFAQESDLVLPGEKWLAGFDKYICVAYGEAVARPAAFETLNVQFERLTTDSTLDNGLIKATFEQDGKACRYNAFILADNAAQTSKLVESKAYAPAADADCAAGKAVIDAAFAANQYLYFGHPHNLAFMLPSLGTDGVCGAGAAVGATFVVKGVIEQPKP